MTIPNLFHSLLERTATSVSINATTDRASNSNTGNSYSYYTGRVHKSCSSAACSNSSSNSSILYNNNYNNNNNNSKILACSPPSSSSSSSSPSVQTLQAKLLAARKRTELFEETEKGVDADGYPLCQYRKGFFDHLKPKSLFTSTMRITIQQGTTILAAFVTEQLELDMKRSQKVNEGEITRMEADLEAEEWEKIEWNKRWKIFPKKLVTALVKYHAVTLILRFYEFVASKVVDLHRLDKLTMDPSAMSKRLVAKIESSSSSSSSNNNNSTSQQNNNKETVWDHKIYVVSTMTDTTLWANLLPFCADYSLHQALLCYGYYKYYNYQRQRRLHAASAANAIDDDDDETENSNSTHDDDDNTALAKDLVLKSSRLAANRGLGLVCSSIGAGIGSVVWPGWGTIVVSSFGDVAAGMVLDDGYHRARQSLEEKQRKERDDDDDSISRLVQ